MSSDQRVSNEVGWAVSDAVSRSLAVVGLLGVALIHVLDAHGTFVSTPYQGWLYEALITGCLATAVVLIRRSDLRAWLAGALLPLGAMLAYVCSRTVGLPDDASDSGNWWQSLGVASLFVEASVVALCATVFLAEHDPWPAVRRARLLQGPELQRGAR